MICNNRLAKRLEKHFGDEPQKCTKSKGHLYNHGNESWWWMPVQSEGVERPQDNQMPDFAESKSNQQQPPLDSRLDARMKTYMLREISIEAYQWHEGDTPVGPPYNSHHEVAVGGSSYVLVTLRAPVVVRHGDWVLVDHGLWASLSDTEFRAKYIVE